jgi:hypothetical protein
MPAITPAVTTSWFLEMRGTSVATLPAMDRF